MIDDTPYIIIDNQKISPIGRLPRSNSATADPTRRDEPTYGVVDRVTISKEAREKSRQLSTQTEAAPPAFEDLSLKSPTPDSLLLTYSPQRLQP